MNDNSMFLVQFIVGIDIILHFTIMYFGFVIFWIGIVINVPVDNVVLNRYR